MLCILDFYGKVSEGEKSMKRIGFVFLIIFMFSMPIQAKTVYIPDVTGMTESEAVHMLEEVELPNEENVEVIKKYRYSSSVPTDVVYEQSLMGEVSVDEAESLDISISMGQEPKAPLSLLNTSANRMTTFGLARYLDASTDASSSKFGIDWDSLPCSYEYNWDNSDMCWKYGMWINGVCYKTPEGEFSTDVRHKLQIYCDGTYVYTRVIFARDFWTTANGDDYRYFFDDEEASFRIVGPEGNSLTSESKTMETGTNQVGVQHSNGHSSGKYVNGAIGYLTKFESGINAILEIKIPLSEYIYQNPDIDMDTVGTIQFFSPNIMYRRATASGADTSPFLTAGFLLAVVPGSAYILRKYHQKRNKDEQKV